jgi:transposase InsO family protein
MAKPRRMREIPFFCPSPAASRHCSTRRHTLHTDGDILYTFAPGGGWMPWSRGAVDEHRRLISLWEAGHTPTELSRRFGVSRPTVYETIGRWMAEGEIGLEERSRRPHSNGRQTPASVSSALLSIKDRYPHYGPDKLVRLLRDGGIELSASTARDILRRNGRVQARRARPPRWSPARPPAIVVPGPGHSMSADHKGKFLLGNRHYCYPLTIADPASRYVFVVEALASTSVEAAIPVFERVFRRWGLPEQIITDNGIPFCNARALGGLTELSKMWIKLGIQHVRIEPGRPQQNGIHERMHGTLKRQATQPPEPNMRAQQQRFDFFTEEFNNVRPHQALGQEPPASRVQTYRRTYPARVAAINYPMSFQVRRVRADGRIKWKGEKLFVSDVLRGEAVAMLEVDNDRWHLFFGTAHLATWDGHRRRFEQPSPQR